MNWQTWALIALCVAGIGVALCGAGIALASALRVRRHVSDLQRSRLMLSVKGLQIQTTRLQKTSQRAMALQVRAAQAVALLKESAAALRLPSAEAALEATGAQLRALLNDLR